jgi:hypothetical protein
MPDQETKEMQIVQVEKATTELHLARDADEPAEERTHERRAERAAYLKAKLDERARSEDARTGEAGSGDERSEPV